MGTWAFFCSALSSLYPSVLSLFQVQTDKKDKIKRGALYTVKKKKTPQDLRIVYRLCRQWFFLLLFSPLTHLLPKELATLIVFTFAWPLSVFKVFSQSWPRGASARAYLSEDGWAGSKQSCLKATCKLKLDCLDKELVGWGETIPLSFLHIKKSKPPNHCSPGKETRLYDSARLGWGLKMCVSTKFPADATGLETLLWEPP